MQRTDIIQIWIIINVLKTKLPSLRDQPSAGSEMKTLMCCLVRPVRNEYRAMVEWWLGGETVELGENPAPVPLRPPRILLKEFPGIQPSLRKSIQLPGLRHGLKVNMLVNYVQQELWSIKAYWGGGGESRPVAQIILALGTMCRTGQLHTPVTLTPGKELGTHRMDVWVGPRPGLKLSRKDKSLPPSKIEPQSCSPQPVAVLSYPSSQSRYRPMYVFS
jgi:hypothetical protein